MFFLINLLLAGTYYATAQPSITNYYLNPDGSVLVELTFLNVSQQTIEVSLEQGFDASTLHAVDSQGASLPVDVVGDKALVSVMSDVEWVKLTYLIPENAEVSDDVVFKFVLRPQGDCIIHVHGDFLLLTFTGSPAIDLVDETLLLEYRGVDVVEITVVMLQPTTQTTTSLPPSQPGIESNLMITVAAIATIILVLVIALLYLRGRKHS